MPLPLARFTVRRLMVAVAVVAVMLSILAELSRRRIQFGRMAAYHRRRRGSVVAPFDFCHVGNEKQFFHAIMERKYMRARSSPWISVPPDPPEPK